MFQVKYTIAIDRITIYINKLQRQKDKTDHEYKLLEGKLKNAYSKKNQQ